MKINDLLLMLALTCIGNQSTALPKVGEYAQYNQVQIKADGTNVTREVVMTVVDVSDDGQIVFVEISSSSGSDGIAIPSQVVEMPLGRGDIEGYVTVEIANELISTCEEDGGFLEKVFVPAGEFESCRVFKEDSQSITTTWMALVPSGFVRQETFWKPTGSLNTFELKTYGGN